MNTYGAQMDRKWTGSGLEVTRSGAEVGQKWTGSVHLSARMSDHPKHFPYLLDKPYARDLQAQGACALRFFGNKLKQILSAIADLSAKRKQIVVPSTASSGREKI